MPPGSDIDTLAWHTDFLAKLHDQSASNRVLSQNLSIPPLSDISDVSTSFPGHSRASFSAWNISQYKRLTVCWGAQPEPWTMTFQSMSIPSCQPPEGTQKSSIDLQTTKTMALWCYALLSSLSSMKPHSPWDPPPKSLGILRSRAHLGVPKPVWKIPGDLRAVPGTARDGWQKGAHQECEKALFSFTTIMCTESAVV